MLQGTGANFKDLFGLGDFGKDGKNQEENMRETGWEEYLVRREGWREN